MANIKQQMLSGVFYTAIAKYSGLVISLVVMAILARLLCPDDFGTVAIATVFINFFSIFTNIGISSAIVQNKELTSLDINRIYMFTVWIGIILSALFFSSTGFIANYYQDNRLLPICQLLSVNLFFASAGTVPNTLFFKDKDFKFIAWRTFIIQILVGALAIVAALMGAGLYTLLIQPILSSALIYFISLRKYPQKLLWTWGIDSLKKIWAYSMYQFLFSVMSYFIRNLDKMLIGKYIGMAPLGYYEKSYRLMSLPIQNITYVITPVLHPILSDYQKEEKRLATINERMVRLLAFIGFPLGILLFFCTGFLICILFVRTLEAFAYSMLISYILSFIQCYWQLYHYQFHRSILHLYSQLISPLFITLFIGGLLYIISFYSINWNILISFCIKSFLTLLLWGSYIQWRKEYDIINKVKKCFRKR